MVADRSVQVEAQCFECLSVGLDVAGHDAGARRPGVIAGRIDIDVRVERTGTDPLIVEVSTGYFGAYQHGGGRPPQRAFGTQAAARAGSEHAEVGGHDLEPQVAPARGKFAIECEPETACSDVDLAESERVLRVADTAAPPRCGAAQSTGKRGDIDVDDLGRTETGAARVDGEIERPRQIGTQLAEVEAPDRPLQPPRFARLPTDLSDQRSPRVHRTDLAARDDEPVRIQRTGERLVDRRQIGHLEAAAARDRPRAAARQRELSGRTFDDRCRLSREGPTEALPTPFQIDEGVALGEGHGSGGGRTHPGGGVLQVGAAQCDLAFGVHRIDVDVDRTDAEACSVESALGKVGVPVEPQRQSAREDAKRCATAELGEIEVADRRLTGEAPGCECAELRIVQLRPERLAYAAGHGSAREVTVDAGDDHPARPLGRRERRSG